MSQTHVWSGGHAVECRRVNRGDGGSIPPFQNLGNFVHPTIAVEETLKAGGPFYLGSMPGEVKDPKQGVNL